jgi:hypothetical protein
MFVYSNLVVSFVRSVKVADNVLQLGEVADLEALNFNVALMFI